MLKASKNTEYKFATRINGDVEKSNLLLCIWRHQEDVEQANMQSTRNIQDSLSQEFQTVMDRKLSPEEINNSIADLADYVRREIGNDGKEIVSQQSLENSFRYIWESFMQDLTVSKDFESAAVQEIKRQMTSDNQELSSDFKDNLMNEKSRLLNLINGCVADGDDENQLISFMRIKVANRVSTKIRFEIKKSIENETIYFNQYYWPLFATNKSAYLEKLYQQQNAPKEFKISNLEILVDVPEQAIVKETTKMRDYVVADDKGLELGNIILDCILDGDNNADLKVVMGSYLLLWKPLLKKCFQNRFRITDEVELEQRYRKQCEPYLYELTYMRRGLTAENIHPVGISDEAYQELKKLI